MEVPVAGAVINTIVGSSLKNLISLLTKEFSLIKGVEKNVEKLVSVLSTIQAVMEDAEEQQIKNKQISDWLRKLKDATYDAEDVLDAWALKIQDHNQMEAANKVSRMRFRHKIAKKIKKVISKFDEIADEQKFHLKTGSVNQDTSESQYIKDRETSSVTTEPRIYGAEENKTKIIDILVNTFVNQDDVSICPIVGMGGLGKTTLAQSVYNDERVKRHFELRKWVCVSEPFDVKRILEAITRTFIPGTLEDVRTDVEKILRQTRYLIVLDDVWNEKQDQWDKLKSFLKGGAQGSSVLLTTRSLGVAYITATIEPYRLGALSDHDCFSLFKHHAVGARGEELHPNLAAIGKQIAEKCKGVPLAAKSLGSLLRFKTSEKQWELIRDSEIWTLEETSENTIIAVLRLSYNHLSSRLKQCFAYCAIFRKDFEMDKSKLINSWIANGFIHCQGNMELEEIGDDVFNELLRLSFFQEPRTYSYPYSGTKCKMHDLMHDLASSVSSNECLIVDIGQTKDIPKTIRHLSVVCDSPKSQTDVVDPPSLRTLSFFHSHSIDFHRIQFSSTLRVLDLSERRIETLPPSVCDLIHLRYLDLSGHSLVSLPESIHKLRNLLMLDLSWNDDASPIKALPLSLCQLKCLRYLNLSHCSLITSLPEGLESLSSLRHLNLSYCRSIISLPEGLWSMGSLRHLNLSNCSSITSLPEVLGSISILSYLNISECYSITSLPEGLGSMSSLRHLHNSGYSELRKMPVGIGKLTCLETLSLFVVGRPSDGDNRGGGASISELQGLNQLRGYLKIEGLEYVRNGEDAKEANLSSKTHLSELELCWDREVNNNKEVLEGLLWHPLNISYLLILNYKAAYFPEVFVQNLKSLKSLAIHSCKELVSLPEGLLQKLTSLEILRIWYCDRLKSLGSTWTQRDSNPYTTSSSSASSSSHFHSSSLQKLTITSCPELQFSEENFQNLDALRSLTLSGLPQLTALPQGIQHLPVLRNLEIKDCSNLGIFPEWVKRRERDKGEDWRFRCDNWQNIKYAPEDANEPATEAKEEVTQLRLYKHQQSNLIYRLRLVINCIEHMARLVSPTVVRRIIWVFVLLLLPTKCY